MKTQSSSTEDVFVREMILHGKPDRAIRVAFPLMQDAYIIEAIEYMLVDPGVRHRINAGILYFYKEYLLHTDAPELERTTIQERREFLFKIISGKRKYPIYIRTEDKLSMIMANVEPAAVNDALLMDDELNEIEKQDLPI